MDIRQTIADEMDRQGIGQRELSRRTGITHARINDYVNGKRDMNGRNLEILMDELGIELKTRRTRRKD